MSEANGREIIACDARVGVLLPLVFKAAFDYRVPEGMSLKPGDYVRVPFGRKSVWGVVWQEAEGAIDEKKLKSIEAHAAHLAPMDDAMRRFIDWVAWYTLSARGLVFKMSLPVPEALEPPKQEPCYLLAQPSQEAAFKPTPSRLRIAAYLSDGTPRTLKDIAVHAKVSGNVLREFVKAGGLVPEDQPQFFASVIPSSLPEIIGPELAPEQQAAADVLRDKLKKGYSVTLIDGVTGSGKTEVYFDAIACAIAQGGQALVLLPEIALSVQWLARFKARFGFAPELWHSNVSPSARREAWRRIASGEARVTVGARSALFLPFAQLKLIVVDEEHDASYKQEEGVIYHARDMAVARASHEKIPAVLVSATPSLETEQNVRQGRYASVRLYSRHNAAELPQVRLIDMRREKLPKSSWISEPLKAALLRTLAGRNQAMLLMNRRGYAPLMLCRACGHKLACPHCAAFLVLHRLRGRLLCHHCGHEAPSPKTCPECRQEDTMIPYGPGVERIAEEVAALLPEARVAVMTSDMSDTPAKMNALVNAMIGGDIDILIGTQMIAKGHHFAGLALVGVIDADMGLAGGDLRAGERTYQLLHQVAGRAGREKVKGEVLLQTYLPEHPVMQALAAGGRDAFMELEASMREDAGMPPYGKLASLIIEGAQEREVADFARLLVRSAHESLPADPHLSPLILGPAPAPFAMLRGRHRWRVLIKAPRNFMMQDWLAGMLVHCKTPAGLRVKTDIEPYSFL